MIRVGIVRLTGLELAYQRRSILSRGESAPFSERGGAILLEGIAAVEMAVPVEVVVDRGMGGGEFLQGLHISEFRHRSFSPSERLVGNLGSIVEPPTALLFGRIADYLHRRSVRRKPVGYPIRLLHTKPSDSQIFRAQLAAIGAAKRYI